MLVKISHGIHGISQNKKIIFGLEQSYMYTVDKKDIDP